MRARPVPQHNFHQAVFVRDPCRQLDVRRLACWIELMWQWPHYACQALLNYRVRRLQIGYHLGHRW